jgi:hypothetical protein
MPLGITNVLFFKSYRLTPSIIPTVQIVFNVNTPAEFVDFAVEKITEAVYSPPKFSHAVSILFFYFCSSCLILMYRHFRLKSARALLPLTTIPLCLPLRPPLQRCVECFYVADVHYLFL